MKRPLSPHLQIYAPQLTSILSILHRISGIVFLIALFLVCAWIYSLSMGEALYRSFCDWLALPIFKIPFFLILMNVYYHLLNGVRYLMWSLGKAFELTAVYNTGWIVCFFVLFLTLFTVFFI